MGSTLKGKKMLLEKQIFFKEVTPPEKGSKKIRRAASPVSISIHLNTVYYRYLQMIHLIHFELFITPPFIKCNGCRAFNRNNMVVLPKQFAQKRG